jgi:hypothetical protein
MRGAPTGRSFWSLPRRNPREPLTAKLKFRGGAEAWVEIHARGSILRVPGDLSIAEVVLRLNNWK